LGHQRRHDINRAMISRQYKPHQLREVIGTGTWNTRTMRTIGKVETVVSEMQRMKIGLVETRWTGKGDFLTDAGSTVIYSGADSRKESGVAMILDKERSRSLMGYNPVNSRILTVRLAGRPWNLTLIQVYAPTNQADSDSALVEPTRAESIVSGIP